MVDLQERFWACGGGKVHYFHPTPEEMATIFNGAAHATSVSERRQTMRGSRCFEIAPVVATLQALLIYHV